MIYGVGFIALLGGFALGQALLAWLLRDRSREDLLKDRSLRIYGVLNWLVAILFATAAVSVYKVWLGP